VPERAGTRGAVPEQAAHRGAGGPAAPPLQMASARRHPDGTVQPDDLTVEHRVRHDVLDECGKFRGFAQSARMRHLDDGFVAGEQVTPGAPGRIRLTGELRGMLTDTAPDGWVPLGYATQALGVSRQTVLQKVKRGELNAVLTRTGRRKGLRIEIPTPQQGLFKTAQSAKEQYDHGSNESFVSRTSSPVAGPGHFIVADTTRPHERWEPP
jgi:hypothetical protein